MTLKLGLLIEYHIKNIFMEKSFRKCAPKAPDLLLILVNNPTQPLHAINSFKSKILWKRTIKNPLKSQLYFFFWNQSLLIDKVIKNKRGMELALSFSSCYKKVQKNFFISYILSDQVWYLLNWIIELLLNYWIDSCWIISKIVYESQFMTSQIILRPFVLFCLESVERKGKNYKILNILRMKRAFLMK